MQFRALVGWAALALACQSESEQATASAASGQSAAAEPQRIEQSGIKMGTRVVLVGYTTARLDATVVRRAFDAAIEEISRLEKLLSSWRADSEVSKINEHAGEFVSVSPETFEVIRRSLWISRHSGGAFDVTFQAMSDVWKFGDAADVVPQLPPKAEIEARRRLIDYRKIELDHDKRRVKLPDGMALGLGGIAKGFIVDRAADVLKNAGLDAFLVQAGGDLYGHGTKPDGAPWKSGIQDPRGAEATFFATIELHNHAFSTAGDYARAFVLDGKRYHHIIDPRTGYPATASRSVTIWAPDAFTADAVDDAVFILGPERGLKLVSSLEGIGAVIVDADNQVHISQNLASKVNVLRSPSEGN